MAKGNINNALKLLTHNMSDGILPLNDETISLLHQKHPKARKALDKILIEGNAPIIHPIIFEPIDDEMVKDAALRTRSGPGPSDLVADGWRRLLTSNHYRSTGWDLRTFAEMIKKICTDKEK